MKLNYIFNQRNANRFWMLLPLLLSCALWLPALNTPFWQDDYFYIYNAKMSIDAGESIWASLLPTAAPNTWNWRPLSQEMYWYFVVADLSSNPKIAHLLNIVALYFASSCFGVFAYCYSRLAKWPDPFWIGVLCLGFNSILQLNFMSVYWASAANGSIIAGLCFLSIALFLLFMQAEKNWKKLLICFFLILLSVISLLVKESAVLLPLLCVLVWSSLGLRWKHFGSLFVLLVGFFILAFLWWKVRSSFVVPTPPEYRLQIGSNVIRNLIAQVAWIMNIPREAIRMIMVGNSNLGALWIALTGMPVLITILYVNKYANVSLGTRKILFGFVFAIFAYAPYYLFGWNSYEYYAAVSVGLFLVFLCRAVTTLKHPSVPVALVLLSSFIGVFGNLYAVYPSLIARAKWGEAVLSQLQKINNVSPLVVKVSDDHRFSAIRPEGLALRLNIPMSQIIFTNKCVVGASKMLVVKDTGGVILEDCITNSKIVIVAE